VVHTRLLTKSSLCSIASSEIHSCIHAKLLKPEALREWRRTLGRWHLILTPRDLPTSMKITNPQT